MADLNKAIADAERAIGRKMTEDEVRMAEAMLVITGRAYCMEQNKMDKGVTVHGNP